MIVVWLCLFVFTSFMMVIFPTVTHELLVWSLLTVAPASTVTLFLWWGKIDEDFHIFLKTLLSLLGGVAIAWNLYGWASLANGLSGQSLVPISGMVLKKGHDLRKNSSGGAQALHYAIIRDDKRKWKVRLPYGQYAKSKVGERFTARVRMGGLGFRYHLIHNGRFWLEVFGIAYEKVRGNDINH